MSKVAAVPAWWSEVIELMLSEHCTLVRAASVTGHLLTEKEAVGLAKANENVARHLGGGKIVKTIYVQGRILGFVVK